MVEVDLKELGINYRVFNFYKGEPLPKPEYLYFYKMSAESIDLIFTYEIEHFVDRISLDAPFKIKVPDEVDDPFYVVAYVSNLQEKDIYEYFVQPLLENYNDSTSWFKPASPIRGVIE
jgi:hypothetical protein